MPSAHSSVYGLADWGGGVPQKLSDSKRAVIFDDSEYLLVAPQSAVSFQTPIMLTVCISG